MNILLSTLVLFFTSSIVTALSTSEVALAEWKEIDNAVKAITPLWQTISAKYETSQLRKLVTKTIDMAVLSAIKKTGPFEKVTDTGRVAFIRDVLILGPMREAIFEQAHASSSACDLNEWGTVSSLYSETLGTMSKSLCTDFQTCLTPPAGALITSATDDLISALINGGSKLIQDRTQHGLQYCQTASSIRTMQSLAWSIRHKTSTTLVQWLLRYAYRADPTSGFSTLSDEDEAHKNWLRAYAAYVALQPEVHHCSIHVDHVLAHNLDPARTMTPMAQGNLYVAGEVQRIYGCLQTSCIEVGNNTRYTPPCHMALSGSPDAWLYAELQKYRDATIALGVLFSIWFLASLVWLMRRLSCRCQCCAKKEQQKGLDTKDDFTADGAPETVASPKAIHNSQRWGDDVKMTVV